MTVELTTLSSEIDVDDQKLLDSQLILLGCSWNRRDSSSSENLKTKTDYLFTSQISVFEISLLWFRVEKQAAVWFGHWVLRFQIGCLEAEIGDAVFYILPGVINFHAYWYFDDFWLFLSIWCNRCRKRCLEFVFGRFWNLGCQSVSRTLLWCSGRLQEIVKAPETIVILIIILHFY